MSAKHMLFRADAREKLLRGTTLATILAHAIFSEGLLNIAAGASTIDLKRGLEFRLTQTKPSKVLTTYATDQPRPTLSFTMDRALEIYVG